MRSKVRVGYPILDRQKYVRDGGAFFVSYKTDEEKKTRRSSLLKRKLPFSNYKIVSPQWRMMENTFLFQADSFLSDDGRQIGDGSFKSNFYHSVHRRFPQILLAMTLTILERLKLKYCERLRPSNYRETGSSRYYFANFFFDETGFAESSEAKCVYQILSSSTSSLTNFIEPRQPTLLFEPSYNLSMLQTHRSAKLIHILAAISYTFIRSISGIIEIYLSLVCDTARALRHTQLRLV